MPGLRDSFLFLGTRNAVAYHRIWTFFPINSVALNTIDTRQRRHATSPLALIYSWWRAWSKPDEDQQPDRQKRGCAYATTASRSVASSEPFAHRITPCSSERKPVRVCVCTTVDKTTQIIHSGHVYVYMYVYRYCSYEAYIYIYLQHTHTMI